MKESIGKFLKRERELRRISLEEISEHTRIKKSYLEALETEHFEKLPGFTFARGYLHAYANYIGLSPDQVLVQFQEYLQNLAGVFHPAEKNHGNRLFWLVAFLVLVATASIIMIWFRK